MLRRGKSFLVPVMMLLLLLSAIGPVAAASTTPPPITYSDVCSIVNGIPPAQAIVAPDLTTSLGLTLVALDLAFDIVVIGYMAARVFNLRGLYAWVQGEYYELTKSVLLVVSIYGIISIVSGFAIVLSPSLGGMTGTYQYNIGTLITGSEQYLCTAMSYTLPGWTFIGQSAIAIGLVQGSTIYLYLPIPFTLPGLPIGFSLNSGFSMRPYQNFMLESGNIVIQHFESIVFDLVQFVLFPVTSLLDVLITSLPLIVAIGLSVLIPAGLVMRAFPFIRGIGGTLIAIGIAVSVIFPATLVLLDQPIVAWSTQIIPPPTPGSLTGQCSLGSVECSSFSSFLGGVFDNIGTIISYAWDSFSGIYVFMNGLISTGWYVIIQLLLFVIDLMIIYPLTDAMARMLGGTIRLSLGGKLKMA